MIKKIIYTFILCCVSLSTFAVTPQQMRFHCDKDTLKINALLHKGKSSKIMQAEKLSIFFAKELMGTPYVAHTLEADKEYLTINIDELDCTTFVETLIALTKTTLSGRQSWRDFANNLENIRYRRGNMGDYSSRLHYMSDWIMDNTNRGNIKEITSYFPRSSFEIKSINFMSEHRNLYSALKEDDIYNKIKNIEIGYRSHKCPILKKNYLIYKDIKKCLEEGYIVMLTTKVDGLDVSHLGIITIVDGEPFLLHASSIGNKVMVGPDSLQDMLRRSKDNTGIRVIRITE